MATTVVLGAQWGDEGKGKLIDTLSGSADLCARCAGGNNAGHTIVANGTTYDFHLLPSGLINRRCTNLIGSGVVVHVPSFFGELDALATKGIDDTAGRIFISDRAHVVLDLHQVIDGLEEKRLGKGSLGTTKKGIGPAYSCKASRTGIRIGDIFDEDAFGQRVRCLAEGYQTRYGSDLGDYKVEEEIERFKTYRPKLAEYVVDALPLVTSAQEMNAKILVEGANALMLDVDYGTYPFVTSSNTGIGGAITGLALNPFKIKEIVGVVKAYTTRVGSGPFPTEQTNEVGNRLQEVGKEIGVTTGRRRRCGWLDLVVVKYSAAVNHYTSLNLTKLDVLDAFSEIRVAIAYHSKKDDHGESQRLESFPANLNKLENDVEVEYKTFPGWQPRTTRQITSYDDLPVNAKAYVEFIEEVVGVHISSIGTGPARENIILR